MNILILGASGFIGSAIALSCVEVGHKVRGLGRDIAYGRRTLPALDWIPGDLRAMQSAQSWQRALAGIDVVINCAGTLQSGLRDNVEKVQLGAMRALYSAANDAGIEQVIQISAAGADDQGQSEFMGTKSLADRALVESGLRHCVLRPGLVVGRNCFGGTELLRASAGLPWMSVVPSGTGTLQCVALSDLVEAVKIALEEPERACGVFDLVEDTPRDLREVVMLHRNWLGFQEPRLRLTVPLPLTRIASYAADALGWLGWRSPLRSNSIAALVHGVSGNETDARKLLGRNALSLPQILTSLGTAGKADRWHARSAMLYPLALGSLFVLWLVIAVLGLLCTDAAAQLLVDGGMTPSMAMTCVIAGSLADLAIAAGLLWRPLLGKALGASILVALGYLAGSFVWTPTLWLDPLAPMLKVLPILALSALCLAMSEER